MQDVRWASAVIDRTASGWRLITGAPDFPLAAGVLLGFLAMMETVASADSADENRATSDLSTALLLGLCATTPLGIARIHDLVAAVAITVATFLTLGSDHRPTVAAALAQLACLYLVALRRPRRVSILLLLPFALYAIAPFGAAPGGKFFGVGMLAVAVAAVAAGAAQQARGEAAERDASRRAAEDTLLEHVARGERARIARELHDVVAHHISMIAVQAETARLTTPGMPPEGSKRLVAIGDTARQALTEMRRLLGVLRADAATEPTRQPQPGLAQLNGLVDQARDSSGASARLILHGRVAPLGPGIELTAYRIIQEALTNARRHAPGAGVDVELDYTDEALRLRVRDNGPGCSAASGPSTGHPAAGHGLLGMRERAAMVGGTLSTGPAPGGGFLIEAVLPTVPTARLAG
jgi:signal transduction histidine kinase